MAKPILVMKVPKAPIEKLTKLRNHMTAVLQDEYHGLIVAQECIKEVDAQTFNDVSGLPDVDIKQYIDDFYKK